ncbi:LysR family transcriptional regulator [Paraburkholderia humisilvae]|uniref:HTH-type transcriptional regulator DmlR n=2 Tax=Paraburkholderia humisilvae TaxID=627669 RepID=A0A6J5F668_9BURK|nr:LysR family transcriptional regulator [Paraburkholderia humisilvae]CAB3774338.1 HTH-type transcriptional regulator DmlR [Paraburkholderia humisilvae]
MASVDLEDMVFFVEVARVLSFTGASNATGIPIATLSRRVALLEKRVGVRLFERTTRRLALTEAGRHYFDRCERIMQDASAALEVLRESARRPSGHLNVSMPVEFGLTQIAPIIDEFARHYPEISINADLTPRQSDFAYENVDVVIRLGELRHPSLVVRQLGHAARLFYASPAYLARCGEPSHPKELGRHECILQSYMERPGTWRVVSGKRSVDVDVQGRFSTNNVSMTLKFAEQGHGIAVLSPAIARASCDSGAVRQILGNWSLTPMPVHVAMTSRLVPARVRVFVEFLASRLVTM